MARQALSVASHLGSGIPQSRPRRGPAGRSPIKHSWPQESPSSLTPVPKLWKELGEGTKRRATPESCTVGLGRQRTQGDFKAWGCLSVTHLLGPWFLLLQGWEAPLCQSWITTAGIEDGGSAEDPGWVTMESAGCPEPVHSGRRFPFPEGREQQSPVTKSLAGPAWGTRWAKCTHCQPQTLSGVVPSSRLTATLLLVSLGAFLGVLSSWPLHLLLPLPPRKRLCAHLPGISRKVRDLRPTRS